MTAGKTYSFFFLSVRFCAAVQHALRGTNISFRYSEYLQFGNCYLSFRYPYCPTVEV